MVSKYVNFGFPDTTLPVLTGFNLEENSPIDGMVKKIIVDSPSEFVGVSCFIGEIQILPIAGEITIREPIEYRINIEINSKQRLVVSLTNHDPLNIHTPSIVWELEVP